MAKKKQDKTVDEKSTYDLKEALKDLDASEHLKKGFEYYINHNTLTIKDNTTLQKEFNKFKEFR